MYRVTSVDVLLLGRYNEDTLYYAGKRKWSQHNHINLPLYMATPSIQLGCWPTG